MIHSWQQNSSHRPDGFRDFGEQHEDLHGMGFENRRTRANRGGVAQDSRYSELCAEKRTRRKDRDQPPSVAVQDGQQRDYLRSVGRSVFKEAA